jgi:uncharacterized small protein (DUF1192 family)
MNIAAFEMAHAHVSQAIADAEARGRAESSAEVARLRAEVERLEANLKAVSDENAVAFVMGDGSDWGPGLETVVLPAPTPASAELAADVATVRKSIGERLEVSQHGRAHDCLSRIAAALGLGGRT